MKKTSILFLLVLLAFGPTAWAQGLSGSGTEADPYLITSTADWNTFASNVNGNNNYWNQFLKLTADITVTEMAGTSSSKFHGTFDGNGYTLTFNKGTAENPFSEEYCAPFRYIFGATIKNLHVAGTIYTSNKFAGVVGSLDAGYDINLSYITACRSSLTINSSISGDGTHGGFAGLIPQHDSNIHFTDCLFDGQLLGSETHSCGGFVGWHTGGKVYFTNCLFAPASVTFDTDNSCTFIRLNGNYSTPNYDHCYYKQTFGTAQGTNASAMDDATLLSNLGATWEIINGKVVPVMPRRPLTGNGTEQSPYQIASATDWDNLVYNVNTYGETYEGKYFKLMADINVTNMVGGDGTTGNDKCFSGIFDGQGHTITFNVANTTEQYIAPFRRINGATIDGVKLEGTVSSSNRFAGGIVAYAKGTSTVTNCVNSTSITTTKSNASNGGIVGMVGASGTITITGCVFNGEMNGATNSNETWSGILGLCNTNCTATINDCLVDPVSAVAKGNTIHRTTGQTACSNCYYTKTIGTEQGKQSHSIIAGEYVTMQNAGTSTTYDISGITGYGVGIKYNDVLYAGEGDVVSLNLGYTLPDVYEANGFHASAGTLQGNGNPYSLTMPNDDVLVYTNIDDNLWQGDGTAESPYIITSTSQWDLLVARVAVGTDYSGKYFQLAANITVTTMVGIDGQHAFGGNFDGDDHTLTLNYSTTVDYTAPFRFVDGATIHDLTVDGAINTSKKFAAGFIGQATGTVTINHCHSSVAITSTVNGDGTHAGFVALIPSGETTISGCLFDGRMLGSSTNNNGGFVGWTANDGSLTLENSIFAPAEVTMLGDKTFARFYNDNYPTITNCYYTETFGDAQGKRIYKTPEEVAANGLYFALTAFNKTYYGKVIVTMQTSFVQTGEEIKPGPTLMTEEGILIPQEGNYTLAWNGDGIAAGDYNVTITAAANAQLPIPNAQLIGSKTFEYTVVSMYAPKDLTATTTYNTATISWTGAADSYKVRYKPTSLNTTYFTNFENGLPNDWTTIDADGDGFCWFEMEDSESDAHSGTVYMTSQSFINDYGPLTPNNWLVSPQLPLDGVLKVWMKGQDPNEYEEHVAIYVSTTGNAVADFSDIVLPETIVTNEYVEYTVNLSQYAGAQGYIAIRHFNCTNQFRLDVDDFGLYNIEPSSEAWQEIEVTGTTAVITGLNPETYYAYQVVGIVGEDSYPSAIAVLQTEVEVPEVTQVSVAPQQTTAQVSWEGHGDSFNVRYAVDNGIPNIARVTLTAGDVWEDNTGYQMLLDADANAYGSIILQNGPLTYSGDASSEVYAAFEYKIPENADGALNTQNVVFNNSVTIDIPAGTYDWCITNPSPDDNMMYIASSHGNIGGRQDDYVFEEGKHYVFTVSFDGNNDRVDVEVSPMYGEWTQVTVENGALTTKLTGLTKSTPYAVQVQAVLANGKTSVWSPAENFTTLNEDEIALYVAGYGDSDGGYYLIASPVGNVNPLDVTNMTSNNFDLYRFNQAADLEWENWKEEDAEHYHFNLEASKGYLYAHQTDVTLIFTGTPYTGSGEVTLSKTTGVDFKGWNLVGNPFNEIAYIDREFYTMNGDGSEIMAATSNSIAPMEGIFVIANTDGETMTFTTEEPTNSGRGLSINVTKGASTGSAALMDRAIVRFGEGRQLPKFQLFRNNTKVYIPQMDEDYAVVSADWSGEVSVNFKAKENGTYTIAVNAENVEMGYLRLIDNLTGNDVDLLAGASTGSAPYTFEAKTTDYESRFKLVFATKDGPSTGSGTFAFYSNGSWIVNNDGEATLQVIDLNGRMLRNETIDGSVSFNVDAAPGVYVLRLINGDETRTQKVIVK